jgi:hypothetical protein
VPYIYRLLTIFKLLRPYTVQWKQYFLFFIFFINQETGREKNRYIISSLSFMFRICNMQAKRKNIIIYYFPRFAV